MWRCGSDNDSCSDTYSGSVNGDKVRFVILAKTGVTDSRWNHAVGGIPPGAQAHLESVLQVE
jgi:hypothetical protein